MNYFSIANSYYSSHAKGYPRPIIMQHSPVSPKQYNSFQNSKKIILDKLLIIFTYYCGKASKYNYNELLSKSFMEMMAAIALTCGITLTRGMHMWVVIENVYHAKARKVTMDFYCFLDLLPSAACVLKPDHTPYYSMSYLLIGFYKMYNVICEYFSVRGLECQYLTVYTKQFLLKLKDSLSKLYKIYFSVETIESTFKNKDKYYYSRSFEAYLELMKDFEVYPKLVGSAQLFFVFVSVLESRTNFALVHYSGYVKGAFEELGQYFTLSKFLESLGLVAALSLHKLRKIDPVLGETYQQTVTRLGLSQKNVLKLLLYYMYTIKSMRHRHCRYSNERFTLIVFEEYEEMYNRPISNHYKGTPITRVLLTPKREKKTFYDILEKIDL